MSRYSLRGERWYGANPPDVFGIPEEAHLVPVWGGKKAPSGPALDSPEAVAAWMTGLASAPVERLVAVLADRRNRPLGAVMVSQGTVGDSLAHPREVFAPAVAARASAVLLVHNHPSGAPEFSAADRAMTARLVAAGMVLDIPVLDHVVVARGGAWSSMVERGEMDEVKRRARRMLEAML